EALAHRSGAPARGAAAPGEVALGVQVPRLASPIVAPGRPSNTHRGGSRQHRSCQPDQGDHAVRAAPPSEGPWPAAAASISHTTRRARTRAAGKGDRPVRMWRSAFALFSPVARKRTSRAALMTG